MKSISKRKKKLLGIAVGFAIVACVAGTFAWQTYQDQKLNRVKSAEVISDAVKVTETWSKTPITPGGSATKDAKVTNASDVQVFVRASFEEVMKHLAGKGVETTKTTPTSYKPATAKLTEDIPVSYAGESTTLIAQGWSKLTAITGLPTGVEVWAKGSATANPVTPAQIDYSFETKVFYHYTADGTDYFQKMSADIAHDGTAAAGTPVTSWKVSAANFQYYVYAGGYNYISKNWAASNLVSIYAPAGTTTPTDTSLIGYNGTNNGEVFDYRTDAGVKAPTSLSLFSGTLPTIDGQALNVFADADNDFGGPSSEIKIKFGSLTDTATLSKDKWVYNAEDGWFYYLAKLDASYSASGTAGTTNSLITNLLYGSTDQRYTNVTYDLTIKTEAVQANDITAAQEIFKFDPSSSNWGSSESKKIYDALKDL